MPAQVPQATFLPLSPDFDLHKLVEENDNIDYVARISYEMVKSQGFAAFEKLLLLHVIVGGKPLVIEGLQDHLPSHLFGPAWLRDNVGEKCEDPRQTHLLPFQVRPLLLSLSLSLYLWVRVCVAASASTNVTAWYQSRKLET